MSRRGVRHPIRGVLAGLALGVGAALQLVHHGRIAIGTMAPYAVVVAGVAFGVAWALLTPVSDRVHRAPQTDTGAQPGRTAVAEPVDGDG